MRAEPSEKGSAKDARFILKLLCILIVTGGLPETIRTKCFLLVSLRRMCPCIQLECLVTMRVIKLSFCKSLF